MIEVAREQYAPFGSATEVLRHPEAWAVVNRASREVMLTCRVRPPKPDAKHHDATLTVRLDAPWRRYGDLAWIREETGELAHCGRWAHKALRSKSCRQWAIASRLWPYLSRGEIPATIDIVADAAFVRGRRLRFQAEHEEVWRLLIKPPSKRAVWYNQRKLEIVDRFGELTDKELAKVAAQKSGGEAWEKLDDGTVARPQCSVCGKPVTLKNSTVCLDCLRAEEA